MMKTKLLLLLFCLCTVCVMGQGVVTRNKCKTCGKVLSKCVCNKKQKPTPKSQPKSKPAPQPTPRKQTASYSNHVFHVGDVEFTMVKVEGGTFTMGATAEMFAPDSWEMPAHEVTLSSYSIGETEVTQALWQAVMGSNPSLFKGDDLPVERVSWDDCQTFISKLNNLTGQRFRLPTEAEWEFAARGGNRSNHTQYSGSSNLDGVAWYYNNSGDSYLSGECNSNKLSNEVNINLASNHCKTHPVKTKKANELGLYDMSGNVFEWCQDWSGSYSSSLQSNPTGLRSGSCRVTRGGGWTYTAWFCRLSRRGFNTPDYRSADLGLRLALSE